MNGKEVYRTKTGAFYITLVRDIADPTYSYRLGVIRFVKIIFKMGLN